MKIEKSEERDTLYKKAKQDGRQGKEPLRKGGSRDKRYNNTNMIQSMTTVSALNSVCSENPLSLPGHHRQLSHASPGASVSGLQLQLQR